MKHMGARVCSKVVSIKFNTNKAKLRDDSEREGICIISTCHQLSQNIQRSLNFSVVRPLKLECTLLKIRRLRERSMTTFFCADDLAVATSSF